ncbi:BON domain-containing protein [Coralloluteibacterium stylophorae]|uniref:BON domain-containing protein n=1 Tax=Coralloluteibacterium stylophorae TaxID=1776034 RepID=A0A8J7VRJ6_9GAMM|nr:BON domain-containing protein [Coralloluteibacterium stylophorae]MBS7457332.1 BON domain-containing protein [Coralloluteibacterium stylophorae]
MAHRNDDDRDDQGAWGGRDFAPEQDGDAPRHGRYEHNDYRPGSGDWRGPTAGVARGGASRDPGPNRRGGGRGEPGAGRDYRDEPRYYRGVDFGGFHGHDDEHAMDELEHRRGHGRDRGDAGAYGEGGLRFGDGGHGRRPEAGDWSGWGHGHPGAGGNRPPGPGDRGHAGRGPKGYTRSDERISEDVCERLTHDPLVDASEIEVKVVEGVVTLEGTVGDRRMKHRAEDIAESCSGVRDVDNRVRVRQKMSGGTTE